MAAVEVGDPALRYGIHLGPIVRALKHWPDGQATAWARSTIAGGQWPQQHLHRAGLAEDPDRRRCRIQQGTLAHRHMGCDATWATRVAAPDDLLAGYDAACADGRPGTPWEKLLTPSVAATLAEPDEELHLRWNENGAASFSGNAFVDSSRENGQSELFRRCGIGVATIDGNGKTVACAWAALPGAVQTVPGSETMALYVALRHCVPPVRIFTDHKNLIRAVRRGRRYCTAARILHCNLGSYMGSTGRPRVRAQGLRPGAHGRLHGMHYLGTVAPLRHQGRGPRGSAGPVLAMLKPANAPGGAPTCTTSRRT